jgi:hypothetical protein
MLPAYIPQDGLACYICEPTAPVSVAARAAEPHIAAIAAWAAASPVEPPPVPREAVAFLLGLGPGLTPSGDDFLAGCLVALRAAGRAGQAAALWRAIAGCGPVATNVISLAHLRSAANGQVCERLHHVLNAILSCDWTLPGAGLDSFLGVGHSSPWDTIAGFAVVLRGVNELQQQEPRTT